jgi:hypothetical protein
MPTCFFEATLRGHAGAEAIDNVFWYSAILPLVTDPTNTDVITAAQNIGSQLGAIWPSQLPTDYRLDDCYVRPFKSDGTPGTAVPQSFPIGLAGGVPTPRDGNTLVAIFKATLGSLVSLQAGHAALKRAYWAYGPMTNDQIANDGSIVPAAVAGLNFVAAITYQTLLLVTIPYYFPIKVSKTASHLLTPNITAYREIVTTAVNQRGSVRVSRKNQR